MTGIEAFKYQASDGYESVIHTLFVRDYAQSLVHSAKVNRGPHRREITATFTRRSPKWIIDVHTQTRTIYPTII